MGIAMSDYITQTNLLIILVLVILFYCVIYVIYSKYLNAIKELDALSKDINQLSGEKDILDQRVKNFDENCSSYLTTVRNIKVGNSKSGNYNKLEFSISNDKLMSMAGELFETEDIKKVLNLIEKEDENSMMYI